MRVVIFTVFPYHIGKDLLFFVASSVNSVMFLVPKLCLGTPTFKFCLSV
ncbi:MAG: hypothetical protein NTV43_11785 [Methylococcales bacterium]|nr:hypothetical protein [Methylococcales bacterium]